jgi:hypothetical protein
MTSPSSASDPSAPVSGIFTTEFYLTLSTLVPGIWALLGLDAKHMSVALAVLHVAGLAAPILAIPVYAWLAPASRKHTKAPWLPSSLMLSRCSTL